MDVDSGIAELPPTNVGYLPSVFFHACAVYVPNPSGNPYGPPVLYSRLSRPTDRRRPATLQELLPVGSQVRVRLGLLDRKIVDHVCLAMWPAETEEPPREDPDVDFAVIGDRVHSFLGAADRLEELVAADLSGLSDPNLQPADAWVQEVFDENFGAVEVRAMGADKFTALFHREDVYLNDGKRAVEQEFFRDKPLRVMVGGKERKMMSGDAVERKVSITFLLFFSPTLL